MRNKIFVAGVIVLAMFARAQSPQHPTTVRGPLGKQLSLDLAVNDSQLAKTPAGLALLVYIPARTCQDVVTLYEENRKAASALRVALVPVADEKCREQIRSIPVLFAARGIDPNALGFLIESGILRRIIRTDQVGRMLAEVSSWQGGRQIYEAQCARCHGLDGTDTNYPEIKSLAGIGNRATESKIIEMTELTGAVDLNALTQKDRQALAAYVAGL